MAYEKQATKAPEGRVKRVPVGTRGRIPKFDMEEGYAYRLVNDADDRIERFEEAGWEILPKSVLKKSERRVDVPTAEGSNAQVSVGQGAKAFVMRIRKEYYDEDQVAKQTKVDQSEAAMKAEALKGSDYGKIDMSRS